jgi:carbonic anhydrase
MNRVRVGILVTSVLVLLPVLVWGSDPASALTALKSGNERFVADASSPQPIGHDRRAELAKGQTPFATVLSCADSRVPPELVFNVGLGDLFVVRAAGEVLDKSVLASVEYAVEHVHTPLLVVMGHEFCGAVLAASAPTKESLGVNLDFLVKAIRPAVARAAGRPEADRMKAAILNNVEDVINNALDGSEIVRHAVDAGTLQIVGAYYELESGRVYFADPVTARARAATPTGHK